MSLNYYMRGLLEDLIDQSIIMTPIFVKMVRNKNPPEFGIQKLEDYVLGFVQGSIVGLFVSSYRSSFAQDPPSSLLAEVSGIIFKRTKEIREAIFRAG